MLKSVCESKMRKLDKKAKVFDRLMEKFKNPTKILLTSTLARSFISAGAVHEPALYNASASVFFL